MRLDISSCDIDNLKPITNGRHKGNFGACYLFYGDAIKIIDVDKDAIKKIDVEKRLKEISKFKVEGVSLPKRLVYVNNKFTGYTMPYYNAPNLKVILMKYKQGKLSITSNDINNAYTSILNKIDALISYNRSMIRILNDEKSITKKNYETCISKLAEIGRMVGGLIKANPDVRKSPNE